MNFLAHLHLSGADESILIGNFMADFVKGKAALQRYSSAIQRGIEIHRAIDLYTDTHAVVQQSKERLRPKYRHYAAVIVDVFYDHFLASLWSHYHPMPLAQFADQCYKILMTHYDLLPDRLQEILPYMIRGNWLLNYEKVEGIARALTGMSRRTPYESKMDEATNDLIRHYDDFASEFKQFFPALTQHVKAL